MLKIWSLTGLYQEKILLDFWKHNIIQYVQVLSYMQYEKIQILQFNLRAILSKLDISFDDMVSQMEMDWDPIWENGNWQRSTTQNQTVGESQKFFFLGKHIYYISTLSFQWMATGLMFVLKNHASYTNMIPSEKTVKTIGIIIVSFFHFGFCAHFFQQQNGRYGELFVYALRNFGILCIGLYRFRDTNESVRSPSSKRYVITNPPEDFGLLPTDQVCHSPFTVSQIMKSFLSQQTEIFFSNNVYFILHPT